MTIKLNKLYIFDDNFNNWLHPHCGCGHNEDNAPEIIIKEEKLPFMFLSQNPCHICKSHKVLYNGEILYADKEDLYIGASPCFKEFKPLPSTPRKKLW